MTGPDDPGATAYIVLRSDVALEDSDLPRSVESVWRKRSDLVDQDFVEVLGPAGNMRAYPTGRVEIAVDGSRAQVYEVLSDAADLEALRTDNLTSERNGEPPREQDW